TLTILDQLLEMLKRRENELIVLALRVKWERELGKALSVRDRITSEINEFILNRGRWKPPVSPREDGWFIDSPQLRQREVTSEAQTHNNNIEDFENNIIPPTGEIFDELVDSSNVPVPEHLLVKQENIEEGDLQDLKDYFTFARDVITQRKQVLDYAEAAGNTHTKGISLKDELIKEEENPRGGSVEKDYLARVNELNNRVETSWNSMAMKVIYPEHNSHDPAENDIVREGVIAYHKNLQALQQETNEALKNYQRALRFVKMAEENKKEAARLEEWITKKDDFVKNRKFDIFQEPCRFSAKSIEDYVTGNAQIVMDVHDFDKDELKVLQTRVAGLVAEIKSVGTKCVNTEELNNMMANLNSKLGVLQDNIQILRQREPDEVDAAQKRLAWEDSYKDSRKFIDSSLKESKEFMASKASWNTKTPEDKSAREGLEQEYSIFKEKVETHLQMFETDHKSKYDAFIEASEKLNDKDRRNNIEKRQSNLENDANKLNEHVYYARDLLDQRAAAVEYNFEATVLDKVATELKASLIEAEKNVSKGPSEIDFDTNIKDFSQKVKNIWEEYGSKIPYPSSPIMNEVKVTKNAVIKESAQKRLSSLESMGEELEKLHETYQSSLALQARANECMKDSSRVQDWIAERLKDLNDRKIDPLAQDCLWNESQVREMIEEHEKFKQENTKVDIEDVSQVRRNLETLLEDIKKANCKSVDQKPLRDALDNLNKNFSDLQNSSSLHQLDLNVLQERAKWEDLYGPNSTLLNDLTNQVNDFIANKARWSPETAVPESDLQQEFTDFKQKVSEFEEKPLALTKSAYNDMKSAIKSFLSQQPPPHIANRHVEFIQHYDNLIGRMDLAKQVLDQRDAIDAYLNQSNVVENEGISLKALLKSTEESCEADPGFAEKIATFNESLNNLKKDFVAKILYPKDKISDKDVNASIKQVVDERMDELEKLSKEIDSQFNSYKKTMEFSGELNDALANAKRIEDELDQFIFEKASWQTQDPDIRKDVDSMIKNLLSELDEINNKVAGFEKKTLKSMNAKFDEYQNVMNSDEKDVPEHVEKLHKELNELLNDLKSLDDFAREIIKQRKDVTEYMNNSAMLEKEAREIQKILLTNEPSSPGGEGNTVSNAVDTFADRVERLWDDDASKIDYPKCMIQNDKDRIGRAGDCNSVIREAVNAQNASLKSLANSLNDLLHTHQNVLRRKKMIESYMNQAKDVEAWIQPKSDILHSILNDDTLGESTEGRLRELIGEVDSVEAARQAYNSAFDFAKNLADKLIEEMTYEIQRGGEDVEDIKADLELVSSRAQEIDALWVELQDNVLKSKQRLEQALQVVEFKEKAKGILSKIDDLSSVITNSLVESVSDTEMKDWQGRLNSLEQAELFDLIKLHDLARENLKDNFGILSDKETKEIEAILSNVINSINSLKKLMGEKTEEIEIYKSAQIAGAYINRANDLQKWIDDFIAVFANAKPTYGIMGGDDNELNTKYFHELVAVLDNFQNQLPYRNEQIESIREEYEDITSQEGIRELKDIMKCQEHLNKSWDELFASVDDFKNFTTKVAQWHDQHGTIYQVETNILDGLESRINALPSVDFSNLEAEGKELDENIKKAALILEETKAAANHVPFTPDDNLDETNRQNFDIHHDKASKKLLELSDAFKTALTAAHNASQLAAFHADADRIIKECYEGTAVVKSRHEDLDRSGYYALEVEPLANVLKKAIDEYTESEDKLGIYDQKVKVDLKQEADKLIDQNPEANKDRILNIFSKVTGALEKFSDTVALERRELELVRRVYAHTKSSHDIKNWMSSCKLAMLNIQVGSIGIIDQEAEIVDLEDKVASFQITVDQFKDMSHRVLIPEADSRDIDEPQPEESNPKIKEAVQTRTNRVLEEWYGLNDLLAKLRSSLNASKEAQEVSRTIKDILVAIGQVKERVLNVESFITGEGVPRLPTKDDVIDGVRELDEIQNEVDNILTPRIEALDDMINNLTENDKDEMNALMSSLLEVVDAATTTTPDCPLQLLSVIDLQSRFTELDTKYNYYHPIIVQKLADAQRAAEPLKDDWRVVDRLGILIEQWNELNEVALAKRDELSRLLSGQKPLIKTRPGRSNSTSARVISPGSSPSRLRHRSSTATTRAASRTPTRLSPSPTPGTPGSPRRPPIRLLPHSVNNYIPDPKDQLDVEVARIVNACPVKIKVSMVEGEPGKYMFGEVEPKLCYCRILRSRMVMVRVGGGWAELSKFLVEHANLEQKYIPKARSFVGSDETEPRTNVGESAGGPSFYEANIRFIPKGPELRIEGSEGLGPLALKRMSYTRKVSSRDTNDRSRLIKPSSLAKSPSE
ncbi:21112_t:CDS:2, partial [Dentiscutata erythropus]